MFHRFQLNGRCWCGREYPCLAHGGRARAVVAGLAAAVAAGLLLAGCGPDRPHGTVIGKDYQAAGTTWHSVQMTKRVCSTRSHRLRKSTSTSRSCRTVPNGSHLVADHHPACWRLHLSGGDTVCVSEHTWHAVRLGNHY